ncbi:roadblock/LC7 domain-containing protein [Streptomyces shenzhenensis]|uniref:roadblock/LC7 domain-containing protein n=1 Tax=Streptomyces shenzhenensis TaxID=943815 RepID=UPI0033D73E6C
MAAETADTHSNSLGWLLDEHIGVIKGVRFAVLVSGDGLLKSRTKTLSQEEAEKYAALTASLRATAFAFRDLTGDKHMLQVLVELEGSISLTTAGGDNSLLSVCVGRLADIGVISEQMLALAGRVGEQLATAERRSEADGGVPA